jgi:hypothetical protein
MKTKKRLVAALVLTLFVAISGLAGETQTPPCVPGQIDTPPCASAQALTPDETPMPSGGVLGQIPTPPSATDEEYLTEIASSMLFSILSLF